MPTTISTAASAPRSMILVISNRQTPPQTSCWGFFRWWTWRETFERQLVDLASGIPETVVDFAGGFLVAGRRRNGDSGEQIIRILGIREDRACDHPNTVFTNLIENKWESACQKKVRDERPLNGRATRSGSNQRPCVNRSRRRRWPARAAGRTGGTPGARGRIVLEGSFVRCSGRGHEPRLHAFLR
jgi:hypothetical protein